MSENTWTKRIVTLVVVFVILPTVAAMTILAGAPSIGLFSMLSTLSDFAPLIGLGLALGIFYMFFRG